jgi:vacuolar-type H+-ATPase subunit H
MVTKDQQLEKELPFERIREAESRARTAMEKARADALEIVENAKNQAVKLHRDRLDEAKARMSRTRRDIRETGNREITTIKAGNERKIEELRLVAGENRAEAVELILRKVL